MKIRATLMAVVLTGACCALFSTANAGEKGGMGGGGPLARLVENVKELNLTDDQKTKFAALVAEVTASREANIREKVKNNPELRETMKEMKEARESGDQDKLKELRQKLATEAGGEKAGAGKDGGKRAEFIKKLAEILTPEQMKKLKALREEHGGGAGMGRKGAGAAAATDPNDKSNKPDASKGVPNPFE